MDELYVCPQCKSLYKGETGTKGKCVKDHAETVPLHVTIDQWKRLTAEEKEMRIASALTAETAAVKTQPAQPVQPAAAPAAEPVRPVNRTPEPDVSAEPAGETGIETASSDRKKAPAAEEKQTADPALRQIRSIKTLLILILVLLILIIGVLLYTIYLQYGALYF